MKMAQITAKNELLLKRILEKRKAFEEQIISARELTDRNVATEKSFGKDMATAVASLK